jgi:hypothetical protein
VPPLAQLACDFVAHTILGVLAALGFVLSILAALLLV